MLSLAMWASAQPAGEPWIDLQVNEINRLPVHTSFIANDADAASMSRCLSLDGDWTFNWVANLDERQQLGHNACARHVGAERLW